ncbi:hypothetical protein [Paenibacillus agaridevorans]|uniref:hypothetical protein n=1 Tax=Paenibacillus agaridevorans TaxID=171404 RepID=UPI001BE3DD8C|nr:hypothetical protein [Paenibacillus agaridevorans]
MQRIKIFEKKAISLEGLIEHYSASTDRTIVEELSKGNMTYVSGQTSFQLIEER